MSDQKVIEILAEVLEVEQSELSASTQLEDHNWDSLAVVTFISEVDAELGVVVEPEALKDAETVGDLQKLVAKAA